MAILTVAYDLKTPGRDYTSLIKAIQSLPNCHAQQSVWFVEFNGTPATLRDVLSLHLDTNDVLFVDVVSNAWAGLHMPVCGKWLNGKGR